jgi:glutaminyl-peptide cyclotransferase
LNNLFENLRKAKGSLIFNIVILCFLLAGDGCTNDRIAVQFSKVDGDKAFNYLLDQVNMGPRYIGTDAHILCGDYIKDKLSKFTDRVEEQNFTEKYKGKDVECRNIIAFFSGNKSAKTFLIGAHYDTRPIANMDKDPTKWKEPILGANDGASGVAVLLSIAESLSKIKPERNIILVFFDAEDLGNIDGLNFCLGSSYFAKNAAKYQINYGIVVDMIGDADLLIYKEFSSMSNASELVSAVWKAAWMEGYNSIFSSKIKYDIYDDHFPLNQAGIPSIDIIDFEYPPWHTTSDLPDKCSAESLVVIGNSLLNFIYNSSFETNLPANSHK